MALKVPDASERAILATLVTAWGATLDVKLFKNDYQPVDGSVVGNFTEADFSGYAAVDMAGGAVDPANDAGGRAVATWNEVSFTHNGGGVNNSIYGYYVVDGGGNLLWAERFSVAPISQDSNGDQIRFVPKFTGKSEN